MTTVGFQVWEEGKKVAIKMPQKSAEDIGICSRCKVRIALQSNGAVPSHRREFAPFDFRHCEGSGHAPSRVETVKVGR